MTYSPDTLNSLADKLADLELDEQERAALEEIIDRASDSGGVAAFGQGLGVPSSFGGSLSPAGFRIGGAVGLVPPTTGGVSLIDLRGGPRP